jgi:hypothetical protein
MPAEQIAWTDRAGITHYLRLERDLSADERRMLDILRQQTEIVTFFLEKGYCPPTISQAPPNMLRMMLRILLSNVDNEEIATFDIPTANDLLIQWWTIQATNR